MLENLKYDGVLFGMVIYYIVKPIKNCKIQMKLKYKK